MYFKSSKKIVILFVIILQLLMCCCVGAQNDKINAGSDNAPRSVSYSPVTKVSLGVKNLTLEVGETYTFKVTYTPEKPMIYALKWFITDDSIIEVDESTFTIKALAPGYTQILVESFDGISSAICNVTVNGWAAKGPQIVTSGSSVFNTDNVDLDKITARSVNRYLTFISHSELSKSAYDEIKSKEFFVTAEVKPGTEAAESKRALDLGMSKAKALKNLNVVNLQGTMDQILAFTRGNADLIEVFEGENIYLDDPIPAETDETAKAYNLGQNSDYLSAITTAQNMGYNGTGTTIAVIDTGLNASHEQFKGRVIAQRCFSTKQNSGKSGVNRLESACLGARTEYTSAKPSAYIPARFNHGSHTTGIAAGRDGVAPKAKIVAIQAFSEEIWWCTEQDIANGYYWRGEKYGNTKRAMCYDSTMIYQDQLNAYDWLIETQKKFKSSGKPPILAINMSYGSGLYASTCNTSNTQNKAIYNMFKKLIANGMIPVVATGNSYGDGEIGRPACIDGAVRVGALADYSYPYIRHSSNHNTMVDLLAPGSNILSAFFAYESGSSTNNCSTGGNCYGHYSGTSMAAPMVSGAISLVHQIYPNNKPAELVKFLKNITDKSANYRLSYGSHPAKTFSYSKPVLNFENLAKHVLKPASVKSSWGFDKGIWINVDRNVRANGYTIKLEDLTAKKTVTNYKKSIKTSTSNTDYTTIKLYGTLVNGHIYKVTLTRYHSLGGTKYTTKETTLYASPASLLTNVTATPGVAGAVKVDSRYSTKPKYIRYGIYDPDTNKMVKTLIVTTPKTAGMIRDLQSGKRYFMRARPFTKYSGQTLWGTFSPKVYFTVK